MWKGILITEHGWGRVTSQNELKGHWKTVIHETTLGEIKCVDFTANRVCVAAMNST